MSKILFVSNTANFSKFNRPYMQLLKKNGWTVHYASAGEEDVVDCDISFSISISRSPFSIKNIWAVIELKKIISTYKYDIIHCHTPMGGVIARIAGKSFRKYGLKIVYTAHGFHFYKGAPLLNWLLYYPIEKYLSKFTDALITINKEDYTFSNKQFNIKNIYMLRSVGINLEKFYPLNIKEDKVNLRNRYAFSLNDFILLYVAEFIPRKNHKLLFDLLPSLKDAMPNLKVILAGKGPLLDYYVNYARANNLADIVSFVGYVDNIADYYRLSDLFFMPSFQEGLPMAVIEALATGLPVVCSKIRGHIDVIQHGKNGFLCDLNKKASFFDAVIKLCNDSELRDSMRIINISDARKYSIDIILNEMMKIYSEV